MNFLYGALVANAAALSLNWIYDMNYLNELSKTQNLCFQLFDENNYRNSKSSYNAYPNAKIGHVSLQGEISKWLYKALKDNKDFTAEQYLELLKAKFSPGGSYHGYVESYGKKLVFNDLVKQLKLDHHLLQMNDDQLVGFVPYIVCKALNLSSSKALEFTYALTDNEDYFYFFNFFDLLLAQLTKDNKKERLKSLISNVPVNYKANFEHAINIEDTHIFIKSYSGTACHIPHALPLIYHLIFHNDSYVEAITKNVSIGGASSDRAMLIGAIFSTIDDIPKDWLELTRAMNPIE